MSRKPRESLLPDDVVDQAIDIFYSKLPRQYHLPKRTPQAEQQHRHDLREAMRAAMSYVVNGV